ncbi:MAG: CPBP family intramembrane metalloprotease [Devosia sp.]|nr:CPBP family intramembrane metalloprotease [Devosia sp.]
MRDLVRRFPVISYYAGAVVLSWTYWLTLLALGLRAGPGTSVSHLPGLLGPAIAALVVTLICDGSDGLLRFVRRFWQLPRHPWPVALAIVLPPLLTAVIVLVQWSLGGPKPELAQFLLFPGVPESVGPIGMLLAVVILNGFGEEIGWRGFATDRLLLRLDPLRATAIVAVLWAFWHVPVFWVNISMAALVGPALVGWLIGLGLGAFALADLYFRSGRSILAVALWHASYNFAVAVPGAAGLPAAIISTAVMAWGAYAVWRFWRHPEIAAATS